jgi:protein-tyrosine phosphatase
MKSVFWLEPGQLGGRPGPTEEPWVLDELRAAGVQAVLNLSEHEPDRADFKRVGIDVMWVAMPNGFPAGPVDEVGCTEMLPRAYAFVSRHLQESHPVIVHCAWGRERTGLLLSWHLVVTEGLDPQAAVARVRAIRPKALSADGWTEMAYRILSRADEVHHAG